MLSDEYQCRMTGRLEVALAPVPSLAGSPRLTGTPVEATAHAGRAQRSSSGAEELVALLENLHTRATRRPAAAIQCVVVMRVPRA